jgi:dihydrofolate synthase / folylpolyglutamate synthase
VTLEDLLPWLFARTTGGVRWGLERTEELLAGVGDPHRHFRSLHVGGTNGKGSVAALCDAALRASGTAGRIGLYTSHHLIRFAERIRVDGMPVSDDALISAAERLRPAIERTGATFFEATTALAFLCFREAGVDTAVVEVGLGGRLDATNVIEPVACAVTNVTLDHMDYLGDTLEAIAREKAGIFKSGVPAITAARGPALAVLRAAATAAGTPLHELSERVELLDAESKDGCTRIELSSMGWGRLTLELPLAGAHQVENASLAAELLALLPPAIRPSRDDLRAGFRAVRWPGRLQVERRSGTTWVFDVAHNPAGVSMLAEALPTLDLPGPRVLLVSALADKEWREMLPPLVETSDAVILTTPDSAPPSRVWDPGEVAAWLESQPGMPPVRVIPSLTDAVARASTLAPHGTVLVTGSFHTVGDAMAVLGVPSV